MGNVDLAHLVALRNRAEDMPDDRVLSDEVTRLATDPGGLTAMLDLVESTSYGILALELALYFGQRGWRVAVRPPSSVEVLGHLLRLVELQSTPQFESVPSTCVVGLRDVLEMESAPAVSMDFAERLRAVALAWMASPQGMVCDAGISLTDLLWDEGMLTTFLVDDARAAFVEGLRAAAGRAPIEAATAEALASRLSR